MAAFAAHEGLDWNEAACRPALTRLIEDAQLGLVLVAVAEDIRAYGVATFNYDLEFAGRDAFVTELYVHPANRGRGLGRQMLAAIAEAARTEGVRALHLMVRPANTIAQRLYESMGFETMDRLVMTRRIASE